MNKPRWKWILVSWMLDASLRGDGARLARMERLLRACEVAS